MTQVTIETTDRVALVTITNPPRGYMNAETVVELNHAVDNLAADPDVAAIVFTGGVPDVFIRHYDVAEILSFAHHYRTTHQPLPPADRVPVNVLMNKMESAPKPVIAAINGMCMGGGFEFALSCDVRLAGPGAYSIGLPEIHVGIFPGAGGTQRLARAIGTGPALNMILRGITVGPEEAAARGLVHDFINGDVIAHAMELGREFARKPARALSDIKRLVRQAHTMPLQEGQTHEWSAFAGLLREDDGPLELMNRFMDGGEDIRNV